METDRKVHYIDVSKLTQKQVEELLGIEHVPIYKSWLFWALLIVLTQPLFYFLVATS
jgi:hypothetical protein